MVQNVCVARGGWGVAGGAGSKRGSLCPRQTLSLSLLDQPKPCWLTPDPYRTPGHCGTTLNTILNTNLALKGNDVRSRQAWPLFHIFLSPVPLHLSFSPSLWVLTSRYQVIILLDLAISTPTKNAEEKQWQSTHDARVQQWCNLGWLSRASVWHCGVRDRSHTQCTDWITIGFKHQNKPWTLTLADRYPFFLNRGQ